MRMIKPYLVENVLVADGAMGTYFTEKSEKNAFFPELANISDPENVTEIHKEYLDAGAMLIRTNTFSANTRVLNPDPGELKRIIRAGYLLAQKAAEPYGAFVAADIGPVPEVLGPEGEAETRTVAEEYRLIIDAFLGQGASIFNFETFSSAAHLPEAVAYIRARQPEAFIMAHFASTVNHTTRKGIPLRRIFEEAGGIPGLDVRGLNCGTGPAHQLATLKRLDLTGGTFSSMPNAGFPEIVNERTVYSNNADYFAMVMADIAALGVRIVGGCCGTTPLHIRRIRERLSGKKPVVSVVSGGPERKTTIPSAPANRFYEKLSVKKRVIAVELDPPHSPDFSRVEEGFRLLRGRPVDIITVADSPAGRMRVSSLVTALRVRRESGVDVLPHFSCRDRNLLGLKSDILAGYLEGIRNCLIVTGDPIPREEKSEVKSVFNCNSISLLEIINGLNSTILAGDPIRTGAALNPGASQAEALIARTGKKVKAGASFFLTQPVFEDKAVEMLRRMKSAMDIKILGGILPLVSYRNALFLNNEFPGIHIPDGLMKRFEGKERREEGEKAGIEIALEIAEKLKPVVDGYYLITPFFRVGMVSAIISAL